MRPFVTESGFAAHAQCSTPMEWMMHKMTVLGISILVSGCVAPKVPPCGSASGSTVTVRGVASQRLKPDGVSFSVGVETRAASVAEAFNANSKKLAQVVAALKAAGVGSSDLQTSELDVSSLASNSGALTGFRVSNTVSVRQKDVSRAPDLIQAAVAAGANQVGSLQFFLANKAAAQQKGLELALADARAKAQALASLTSRTLGDVVCISDTDAPESPLERLAALGYVGPTVEPGMQDVRSAVSVVYEIK
jgi:uncharacterized protein YggE